MHPHEHYLDCTDFRYSIYGNWRALEHKIFQETHDVADFTPSSICRNSNVIFYVAMTLDKAKVLSTLKAISYQDQDVVSAGIISSVVIRDGHVGFALEFSDNEAKDKEYLRIACEKAVASMDKVKKVTAVLTNSKNSIARNRRHSEKKLIPGVSKVIAIASGKGGVGKSTVAVNLAVSLANLAYKVGIVDADIHGPSIPQMLSIHSKPKIDSDNYLLPLVNYGVKAVSIGFLTAKNRAAIWRGPITVKALYQLLLGTRWEEIDYLIIDLPPGTGDIHLSLIEKFQLSGAVIVSTPQQIALTDAYKAHDMFKRLSIPIIGIVENMSYYLKDGKKHYIFGKHGGRKMAQELEMKLLGEVPLDERIRECCDIGKPAALERDTRDYYDNVAKGVAKFLAKLAAH
jgi:ATP-binding protein involved in chromosome partitioning